MDLPLKSLPALALIDLPEAVAVEDLTLPPELSFSVLLNEVESSDFDIPVSKENLTEEADDKSYLLDENEADHEIFPEFVEVEVNIPLTYAIPTVSSAIKNNPESEKLEIISVSKAYPEVKASPLGNKLLLSSSQKDINPSTPLLENSTSAVVTKTLVTLQGSVPSALENHEPLNILVQEPRTQAKSLMIPTASTQIVSQNVNILNLDRDSEVKNSGALSVPEFSSDFAAESKPESSENLYRSTDLEAMPTQSTPDSKIIQQTSPTMTLESTKPGSASIEIVTPRAFQFSPSIDLAPAVQQHLDYLEKNRPAMVCVQLKLDDKTSVEMTIKLTKAGKLQVNFPEESMPFKNDLIASWKPMQSTIQSRGWILDGPHFSGTAIQPSIATEAVKNLNTSDIARSIAVSSPMSRQVGSKPPARVRFNSLRESLTTQIA